MEYRSPMRKEILSFSTTWMKFEGFMVSEMSQTKTNKYHMRAKSLQLCSTLCNSMDCSLPGSSVHGILQAGILEWVAMHFSRGSSQKNHRYTCIPHPEPPSLLSPCTIPLVRPSAPAPSIQYHALNLDWRFISYMMLYMFQCHSPKSSHPLPLPQSPKDCSIHLCLFRCLAYRVIVTIFLNSIYMR